MPPYATICHHMPPYANICQHMSHMPPHGPYATICTHMDHMPPYVKKKKVFAVTMKECEPTRQPESTSTRIVYVYLGQTSRLYIDVSSIPWLLTWMHDELFTGGVPVKLPLEQSSAVADLDPVILRWDFEDFLFGVKSGAPLGCVSFLRVCCWVCERLLAKEAAR